MGRLGRYIDESNDEQRDRVIVGRLNDGWKYESDDGCGCVVGLASDQLEDRDAVNRGVWPSANVAAGFRQTISPAGKYPLLVVRFGFARVSRAVKMRAAKNNRIATMPQEVSTARLQTGKIAPRVEAMI